jgi:hypothetical protein
MASIMITLTNDLLDNYNMLESLKIFVKLDDDVRSTYVTLLALRIGKSLCICAGFGSTLNHCVSDMWTFICSYKIDGQFSSFELTIQGRVMT